jgi:aryl-alcohol dehydrogenase-like predicted oxidoreductase
MIEKRRLGQDGASVGALGLGCMGMSWAYAESSRDDQESAATIRHALDLGISLLDTADVYGVGHNEALVGSAVRGRRDEAVIATKCGLVVDDAATQAMHRDGSPGHVREAVRASLTRLGVEAIDLYYLHRVDDHVPLEETWGAMAELVGQGLVRYLGLSEVSVAQAAAAHAIHPVRAVQSELSLWTRDPLGDGGETSIVAWCARNGAAFVPFAPLGRGFLTAGIDAATSFEPTDFRSRLPRFTAGARAANAAIVDVIKNVARSRDASAAQVALAWVLAQGDHVIPIPGTRRRDHLDADVAALALKLTPQELALLDGVPAATGSRY